MLEHNSLLLLLLLLFFHPVRFLTNETLNWTGFYIAKKTHIKKRRRRRLNILCYHFTVIAKTYNCPKHIIVECFWRPSGAFMIIPKWERHYNDYDLMLVNNFNTQNSTMLCSIVFYASISIITENWN